MADAIPANAGGGRAETPETAVRNLAMLVGRATVACRLTLDERACAVESLVVLAEAAGMQTSEAYELIGISPV